VGSAILRKLKENSYSNFVFTPSNEYDLTNQQIVINFFEKEKPEYVILAAAKVGGIVANNTYRAQFIYENLQIQNNIIHQSYKFGVKKLLFLGSSCIYPKNSPQPMIEDYLLTDILEYTNEPYAISKIAGIKMCESYNLQYGTNFISVMPTNLYGQNDNFDLEKSHVLPAIIRKIFLSKCLNSNNFDLIRKDIKLRPISGISAESTDNEIIKKFEGFNIFKNKLILWGSGNPKREFLHSDDLADACVYLMENIDFKDITKLKFNISDYNKFKNYEIRNTHINIGSGTDLSIKELAEMIKKIENYEGEILWDTTKPDGTFQKLLDTSLINNLNWNYKIKLEDGINKVYENYINSL
ncbi:MAG: GDP-L-fucose synthase, partial [Bacteroidales bacterium]|nr:GDP-L-fucose synthase [Bacteroidales bacterium]